MRRREILNISKHRYVAGLENTSSSTMPEKHRGKDQWWRVVNCQFIKALYTIAKCLDMELIFFPFGGTEV
jgi:hypothetical protein